MGCCLSRRHQRQAKDSSFRENPKVRNSHEPHLPGRDLPPEPEVETVKEVLSETPKPRVKGQQGTKPFPEDTTHGPTNARDERSEDDSVSENFSVQTTTTKKRGDEVDAGEQRPRSRSPAKVQKKRSFSGELSCKRERCVAGGMLRRADGRTMSARETGPRSRDLGERSGRRSVSPAAKQRASGPQCRSLSAPRTSPRRVPPRRVQEVHGRGGLEAKESLENPLVSLECFIFL